MSVRPQTPITAHGFQSYNVTIMCVCVLEFELLPRHVQYESQLARFVANGMFVCPLEPVIFAGNEPHSFVSARATTCGAIVFAHVARLHVARTNLGHAARTNVSGFRMMSSYVGLQINTADGYWSRFAVHALDGASIRSRRLTIAGFVFVCVLLRSVCVYVCV